MKNANCLKYDIFLLYAEEDKNDIVIPLVELFIKFNVNVYFEKSISYIGENVIEDLRQSQVLVPIISHDFIKKERLFGKLSNIRKKCNTIFPILHGIAYNEIGNYSNLFPQEQVVTTKYGIDIIVKDILSVYKMRLSKNIPKIIIGISGPSGAGKSWFTKKLKGIRPNSVCVFTLDSYYKDVNIVNALEYRHDNPNAIDYDKALKDLELLLSGHEFEIPIYDYDTHEVVDRKVCTPAPMIVIEGLFVFANSKLLDKMNLKIWIDADEDLRLKRRINRDVHERGDNLEEAQKRYYLDVKPAYLKYMSFYKKYADLIYLNNLLIKNEENLPLIEMIFSLMDIKYQPLYFD